MSIRVTLQTDGSNLARFGTKPAINIPMLHVKNSAIITREIGLEVANSRAADPNCHSGRTLQGLELQKSPTVKDFLP